MFDFDNILNRYEYKFDIMKAIVEFVKKLIAFIQDIAKKLGVELPTLKA